MYASRPATAAAARAHPRCTCKVCCCLSLWCFGAQASASSRQAYVELSPPVEVCSQDWGCLAIWGETNCDAARTGGVYCTVVPGWVVQLEGHCPAPPSDKRDQTGNQWGTSSPQWGISTLWGSVQSAVCSAGPALAQYCAGIREACPYCGCSAAAMHALALERCMRKKQRWNLSPGLKCLLSGHPGGQVAMDCAGPWARAPNALSIRSKCMDHFHWTLSMSRHTSAGAGACSRVRLDSGAQAVGLHIIRSAISHPNAAVGTPEQRAHRMGICNTDYLLHAPVTVACHE
jgi:hypothetical protein